MGTRIVMKEWDREEFAALIRERRQGRLKWTQSDLAHRMGKTKMTILRWENPEKTPLKNPPERPTVIELEEVLGIHDSSLLLAAGYLPVEFEVGIDPETGLPIIHDMAPGLFAA